MESKRQEKGIEERVELSLLYDFYGALLKENQQQMFEAYILDDFSISEIADDMGITRQGVHDAVKRASKQLREYEEKLGLVERFEQQKEAVKRLHHQLREMDISAESPGWTKVFAILGEILEEE